MGYYFQVGGIFIWVVIIESKYTQCRSKCSLSLRAFAVSLAIPRLSAFFSLALALLSTNLYSTASLLRPARCYTPPPPYFQAKLLYRVILPPLHAPPPRAARASLRYCSSCTCMQWHRRGGGELGVLEHPPCGDYNVYGRGWSSAFMHAQAGAWLPTSMDSCTLQCKRWPAQA